MVALAWAVIIGNVSDVSGIIKLEEWFQVIFLGAEDIRWSHSGESASTGEGAHAVIVGEGRDLVSAVYELRVGQKCFLEPGHELALERI